MTKRLLSLLLAAALLCAVCCCAWADGKDKYQAFVDKYGPDYEDEIDWAQFIEDMEGPEAIDWKKLVHTIGYEGEKKLEYRWEELYDFLDYEPFMEMYALVMEADEELAQERFYQRARTDKNLLQHSAHGELSPGYQTRYENVGVYASITDRCCDGGTIVNYRVPKTGDEAPVWLWLGCAAAGLMVMTLALRNGKRKKAHAR